MASMDVTCTDGWLSIQCQGQDCGASYNAPAAVPAAMAAAVRRAADHVCGRPDDPLLLMKASDELNRSPMLAIPGQQHHPVRPKVGRDT